MYGPKDVKAMAVAVLAIPMIVGGALLFAAGFGLGAWIF